MTSHEIAQRMLGWCEVGLAGLATDLLGTLESRLSRFRPGSDIARLADLAPGEKMRLSEPAFACLAIAKRMEQVTGSAFCPTPAALSTSASVRPSAAVPSNAE